MFNSFGNIFRLTSFGESHGPGVGGVIDGFPAGITIDMDFVQQELNRRRPGQSLLTTSRQEPDKVEFLSGIFEGKSTGCPIGFIVWNKNQHSNDYENIRNLFRPSHADYTYTQKYGIRDYRGGGRSSARETISRVVAGALAKQALKQLGISITAYTSQVGDIKLEKDYKEYDLDLIETNDVRCPDTEKAEEMATLIKQVKADGDTIGGVISCVISCFFRLGFLRICRAVYIISPVVLLDYLVFRNIAGHFVAADAIKRLGGADYGQFGAVLQTADGNRAVIRAAAHKGDRTIRGFRNGFNCFFGFCGFVGILGVNGHDAQAQSQQPGSQTQNAFGI